MKLSLPRRVAVGTLGLLLTVTVLGAVSLIRPTSKVSSRVRAVAAQGGAASFLRAALAAESEASSSVPSDAGRIERTALGRGGTLAATLQELGIPAPVSVEVLDAVGRHINLKRLSPRTGVTASFDEDGLPIRVTVRADAERYARVHLTDGGARVLCAELRQLPLVRSLERTRGTVRSSLNQSLGDSAESMQLANAFAEMFQWDLDLLVDPRPGDRFRIVYEVLRLGHAPEDLPAFGKAPQSPGEFVRIGRLLAASYDGEVAHSVGYWIESEDGSGGHYDETGRPLRKAFLKSPLNYRRISSGFSNARVHPVTRRVVPHHGVDFAANPGTPVVATADGKVFFTGWAGALGKAVRIRHGGSWVSVYGHLSGYAPGIRNGTQVRQNQVIGYVGATGRATGPHLHYTLLRDGRPLNPMTFDNPPAKPLPDSDRYRLKAARSRWLPWMDQPGEDTLVASGAAASESDSGTGM